MLAVCGPAFGQEQADPFAELGLIEDDAAVEDEAAVVDDPEEAVAAAPQRPVTEDDVLREHAPQ